MPKILYRTWIEIDKKAVSHNFLTFKKLINTKTKLLGVVKSNAYGHELMGFSRVLSDLGIDWLGVDSITEAHTLRRHKINNRILVLGYTLPANFDLAGNHGIALTISDFINLGMAKKHKGDITIHLKIDTGMHRQGFLLKDLPKALSIIKNSKNIKLQGVYTHFAAAKAPDWSGQTQKQIEQFEKAVALAKKIQPNIIAHASASAGTLNYAFAHFDMVRVGAGLYGLWPSLETKLSKEKQLQLKPVLTWKTIISEVKTLEKGEKIGYDFTEELKRKTRVAILPIGYWHGYWRALSGKACVLAGGKRAKVLGRISMDMTAIDITDASQAKVGDEVVLIGRQGKENITADELAEIAGTTNYEIITRINPLIKKFFI